METESFDTDAALEVLDSSLTPSALKKLSKSVMDLSTMSEMKELSKSTSNLMTGGITMPKFKKKKPKSESKSSLLRSSHDSLSTLGTIDVILAFLDLLGPGNLILFVCFLVPGWYLMVTRKCSIMQLLICQSAFFSGISWLLLKTFLQCGDKMYHYSLF